MSVNGDTVLPRKEIGPVAERLEAIVDGKVWPISLAKTSDVAQYVMHVEIAITKPVRSTFHNSIEGMNSQRGDYVHTNIGSTRLVHDTKERDDVLVLGLVDELDDDAHVVQTALGIGETHDSHEEVDEAVLAGVIVAILGTRESVQIKVDTDAVLASPSERLESVLPRDLREERLFVVFLDSPEGDRNADPIQAGASDLGEILLSLGETRGNFVGIPFEAV